MPIRQVPNSNLNYYLINFDDKGKERAADDGRLLSPIALQELSGQGDRPITDVFLMSHGWLGDIPAAIDQYDRWLANFIGCAADLEAIKQKRPGFRPLLIGLHWPSKPWGDEDTGGSFALDPLAASEDPVAAAVEEQMKILGAPASARPKLKAIYKAYLELDNPTVLPEKVKKAYLALDKTLKLESDDREPFDPEAIFQNSQEMQQQEAVAGSFGGFSWSDLLAPLRALSFWKMKDRARNFGESGANQLLLKMQQASVGRDVRYHLMGHSFGCIVVSALAAGAPIPPGSITKPKPVNSMILVQGAMSLWAFCPIIPKAQDKAGYFNPLLKNARVKGPILTTLSEHDTANSSFYPLGAGLKKQVDFAVEMPKYGAIGSFGIQGLDDLTEGIEIGGKDHQYGFKAGRIYNLESSNVIKEKVFGAGAHSDIAHPEIAHAWWQAAMVD